MKKLKKFRKLREDFDTDFAKKKNRKKRKKSLKYDQTPKWKKNYNFEEE